MGQPDLVKQPDVQVVEKALVGGPRIVGTPDLVVEIHSPSTKVLDLTEKRHVYGEAGIPAYWMVDPDASTITVLELRGGAYVEVAVVGADRFVRRLDPVPYDHRRRPDLRVAHRVGVVAPLREPDQVHQEGCGGAGQVGPLDLEVDAELLAGAHPRRAQLELEAGPDTDPLGDFRMGAGHERQVGLGEGDRARPPGLGRRR